MNKISLLIASLVAMVNCFSQATIIAPVNPPRIFPIHVQGDRDFWGHGPHVTGDVRVVITEGKGQLLAFINLRLEETEGDKSAATIDETRVIYNAPAGKQIRSITTRTLINIGFRSAYARSILFRRTPYL